MSGTLPKSFTFTRNELDQYEASPSLKQQHPYYVAGFDKQKRPIVVIEIGKVNILGSIRSDGRENFEKYQQQSMYRLSTEAGWIDTSNGVLVIANLTGYDASGLTNFTVIKYTVRGASLLDTVLDADKSSVICVNMNRVTEKLVSLARPFARSIAKNVEFFGTDKAKFVPRLLELVAENQLPPEFGGNAGWRAVKQA